METTERKMYEKVTLKKGTQVGMGKIKQDYEGYISGIEYRDDGSKFYRVTFTDRLGRERTTYIS